jgi:membrane protease YdiL (CAAX protease family)
VKRAPSTDLLQALVGLGLALAAFSLTFGGPRTRFWQRMTCTGALLGGLAIAADPKAHRPRLAARDLLQGLLSAGGLYLIFQLGDRLARRLLPSGAGEINDIYALRALRPRLELAVRLGAIIGPAEELFWRGYLQRRLERRFGRWPGAALTVLSYASVHLAARNLTLPLLGHPRPPRPLDARPDRQPRHLGHLDLPRRPHPAPADLRRLNKIQLRGLLPTASGLGPPTIGISRS